MLNVALHRRYKTARSNVSETRNTPAPSFRQLLFVGERETPGWKLEKLAAYTGAELQRIWRFN